MSIFRKVEFFSNGEGEAELVDVEWQNFPFRGVRGVLKKNPASTSGSFRCRGRLRSWSFFPVHRVEIFSGFSVCRQAPLFRRTKAI
jgi:hypothetical protein